MALETATYITDLVPTNPTTGDQVAQGDDHIRLLKQVLQTSFPNINGIVTAAANQLNERSSLIRVVGLRDANSTSPALFFDAEPGLGLYRSSAGHMAATGRMVGNGLKTVGEWTLFAFTPASSIAAVGGTATGAEPYVTADGSTYLISTFPDLGTAMPNDGTHFTVPNTQDTGRFLRSTASGLAVGTTQSNVIKAHTHTATVTEPSAGAHTHTATVTDPGHTHAVGVSSQAIFDGGSGATPDNVEKATGATTSGSATTGITVSNASAGAHTHGTTVAISTDGSTETRPESIVAVFCIKT